MVLVNEKHEVREVLSQFLKLNDIDVLSTGNNGKEAVELYEKFKPDIVIMDLLMPKYDGFFGLESILAINPFAKIIIITPVKDFGIKKKIEGRCSAILQHSCEMDKLIDIINSVDLDYAVIKR